MKNTWQLVNLLQVSEKKKIRHTYRKALKIYGRYEPVMITFWSTRALWLRLGIF